MRNGVVSSLGEGLDMPAMVQDADSVSGAISSVSDALNALSMESNADGVSRHDTARNRVARNVSMYVFNPTLPIVFL